MVFQYVTLGKIMDLWVKSKGGVAPSGKACDTCHNKIKFKV